MNTVDVLAFILSDEFIAGGLIGLTILTAIMIIYQTLKNWYKDIKNNRK